MNIGLGLQQKLGLYTKQTPQQILLSSLIQLPLVRLEQRIQFELEQNPFLEEEFDLEEESDQEIESMEPDNENEEYDTELSPENKEDQEVDWETILNDENNYEIKNYKDNSAEVYDIPEAHQTTLPEHLISQLHLTKLTDFEVAIGEYIVWNINDNGYLFIVIEDIAKNFDTSVDNVKNVLQIIQRFDPVGIATRNLQECLLVQIMEMDEPDALVIAILRNHFDDFKNRRFEKIVKHLDITLDEFKEVLNKIIKLNPKPGEGYIRINDSYIIPELRVIKEHGEFKISLNDWNVPQLRVNNSYKRLFLDNLKTSLKTKEYIKQKLESARWLINSIYQRRITILKVMQAIIDRQCDFFENGKEYIKPMILKDIADEISMDISTISRVTSGKYVQTDFGVFELKYFFSEKIKRNNGEDVSNKMIRNRIKQLVEAENRNKPLNDEKIADLLKSEGFNTARRTVAKYREQMMIPVSRLRRKI